MVRAPGLWSSQGVIRVQLNSRWRAPGCTQGTPANVETGRMRSKKIACGETLREKSLWRDVSRSRPPKYLMSCVFLVSMLACSKCMKCVQILWEFCFSVIKPSLPVKLRAPFRIKRVVSLEFCPLRSDILCLLAGQVAIKREYAALGPKRQIALFIYTHVQPETRVDFLRFYFLS